MKHKLLFTVLALIIFKDMHAQLAIKPTIGANFTNFSKKPDGTYEAQLGYQVGGSVTIGRKLYFEPGIFYTMKSTDVTEISTNDKFSFDFSGVRIPLTVGLNLLGNTKSFIGLRLLGGVSAFFITSTGDQNKDLFNTASWGLYAGAGFDISIVFIEASYEWSVTNIQKDVSLIDFGQTRTVYINTGVRIPIK